MNNPDFQTITLPYQTKEQRAAATAFIAGMVEQGLGFSAVMNDGAIKLSFNGGF